MPAKQRPYPSVWARPPRKERSTLTREQIVTQAFQLLDGEGIGALSMRKLAARLGSGTTSLYWHVANRDELIELVIDEVYGELEVPDAGQVRSVDDWREAIRAFARSMRAIAQRHPWLVAVLDHLVSAYLGPNVTRMTEQVLALFEAAGFELRDAERAMSTLSSYVIGIATGEAAWHNWLARQGQTEQDWIEASKRVAERTTAGYERMQKVLAQYEGVDVRKAMDEDFEFGLDVLLAGLEARLTTR
jgi:AcrR family transcriptional regulator